MKRILYFSIVLLLLVGCRHSNEQGSNGGNYETSVQLNWIASCSFAGEYYGAHEYAQKNHLKLKIETGGPGIDPIKMVQSGTNTFGVAGADLVLAANEKGADMVIVGLVSYHSPGVWLAKKEKNIHTIGDLKGKRIGELPGGNMQYLYEVFLRKANLQRSVDFTPVPIPFELKNFIAQDECDLRPVFIYDETSQLELDHMEYTLIEPKNIGIQFKGLSYFCKRETVEKDSSLVQAFINTVAEGWENAISNPEKAVGYIKEQDPTIRVEKEVLGLRKGSEYFKGYEGKVLYTDLESWKMMAEDMIAIGALKNEPDWHKTLNLQFVENYHKAKLK